MTAPITACLLHADYHVMRPECWDATITYFFDHQDEPEDVQRDGYQAAVEALILNALRTPAPPSGSPGPATVLDPQEN